MKHKVIEQYVWDCPNCGYPNVETVLADVGPFNSCTCEVCGREFDRDEVTVTASQTGGD